MGLAINSGFSALATSQGDNASFGMQTGWNRMTALASDSMGAALSGDPTALANIANQSKALELKENMDQMNYQIANAEQDNAKKEQKDDIQRTFGYA